MIASHSSQADTSSPSASTTVPASQAAYQAAGVNLDSAAKVVDWAKAAAQRTHRSDLKLGGFGGFSGAFRLPPGYQQPVLLAACDGVGTKLELAIQAQRFDTVGIDLVAMSVNDLLVQGAEPLIFLDYIATDRIDEAVLPTLLNSVAEGCRQAGCSLLGGETAEMPGFYQAGQFDLAGFALGVAEADALYPKAEQVQVGQTLIGLSSSGLHSNGYSLARKLCFGEKQLHFDTPVPKHSVADGGSGFRPLIEALLEPTRIYVPWVRALLKEYPHAVSAMVHITGGGFIDNLPRVLPPTVAADLDLNSWYRPGIYGFLQELGGWDEATLLHTFNCGLGFVLSVDSAVADTVCAWLNSKAAALCPGATAYKVGTLVPREAGAAVRW